MFRLSALDPPNTTLSGGEAEKTMHLYFCPSPALGYGYRLKLSFTFGVGLLLAPVLFLNPSLKTTEFFYIESQEFYCPESKDSAARK